MISIRNLSFRKKLIAIQLLTAFIVLLFYGLFLVFNDMREYRKSVVNQLTTMAQLIGANSISALNFLDNAAAEEILSSLNTEEKIVNAWICDADGNLFAQYSKNGYIDFSFPKVEEESHRFSGNYITLSKRIFQDGNIIGMVSLRFNMQQLQSTVIQSIIVAFVVLVLGMIIAFFLSVLTQKTISNPILHLVETAKKVSETGDYSIRAKKESIDEIGILSETFNDMMIQIKKRELLLQEAHDILEDRVKERTSELEKKSVELEQANIHLQEVDRLKSVFLASMSHELRTPLNSIIGFTGIILQGFSGEITEEQRKQLTMVKNSAHHLLDLINDVLDVSKIEAGKVDLFPEEFGINDVVGEVVETLSPRANEKSLEILTDVPKVNTLFTDKRRLKQVLLNLVSNAIKFTDRGSVKITAKILNDKKLEIHVIDTGIGIKKEDINKLFAPFQQIDMSSTKSYEGTGLGLNLSRKLANLMGGDISAKSEYGKGSEFILTIPLSLKEDR